MAAEDVVTANCLSHEEERRELVRMDKVDELIDGICGVALTYLSGMAARCTRDLTVRRHAVVYQGSLSCQGRRVQQAMPG